MTRALPILGAAALLTASTTANAQDRWHHGGGGDWHHGNGDWHHNDGDWHHDHHHWRGYGGWYGGWGYGGGSYVSIGFGYPYGYGGYGYGGYYPYAGYPYSYPIYDYVGYPTGYLRYYYGRRHWDRRGDWRRHCDRDNDGDGRRC